MWISLNSSIFPIYTTMFYVSVHGGKELYITTKEVCIPVAALNKVIKVLQGGDKIYTWNNWIEVKLNNTE